jgi:hypothetical protein
MLAWRHACAASFLARLRPAGSPGAAARAGVPADRSRELEVAREEAAWPVMAHAQAEAATVVADATQQAERTRLCMATRGR